VNPDVLGLWVFVNVTCCITTFSAILLEELENMLSKLLPKPVNPPDAKANTVAPRLTTIMIMIKVAIISLIALLRCLRFKERVLLKSGHE